MPQSSEDRLSYNHVGEQNSSVLIIDESESFGDGDFDAPLSTSSSSRKQPPKDSSALTAAPGTSSKSKRGAASAKPKRMRSKVSSGTFSIDRITGPSDLDGIDGTFVDPEDFDSEAEHILEAAQRRNEERRRNKRLISLLGACLMLSVVIATSLWWKRHDHAGGSGTGWSMQSGTGGASPISLDESGRPMVPPPDKIETICSRKKQNTASGWKRCQTYCSKAECCYLPSTHALSCLSGHEEHCATYEKYCDMLDVEIPPAPLNLPQLCSKDSLNDPKKGETNKMNCRDECHASLCCEFPVDQCRPLEHEICHQYWPCAELYGESIEQYEQSSLFLPAPPDDIAEICSPDAIKNGSVDQYRRCADVCHDALCCEEPIEACRVLNPEMCDRYEPCSALYGETVDEWQRSIEIPAPPDDLADRCSVDSIATAKGYRKCEKKCQLASCCHQAVETCLVLNPEMCSQYAPPCDILYSKDRDKYKGKVEVPAPPKGVKVNDVCGASSVATVQGFAQCEDVCDRARCCSESIEYCKVTNPSACDQYSICESFFAYKKDGTLGPFKAQDDAALLQLGEQISSACRDLDDPQGLAACQNLCRDRFCCFEEMKDRNCSGEYQCVVFAACKVLFDQQ